MVLCVLFSAETGAVFLSSAGIEAAFKALGVGPRLHGIAGGRLGMQASAMRFWPAAVGAFVCVSALAGLRVVACGGVSALRRASGGVSALRRVFEICLSACRSRLSLTRRSPFRLHGRKRRLAALEGCQCISCPRRGMHLLIRTPVLGACFYDGPRQLTRDLSTS